METDSVFCSMCGMKLKQDFAAVPSTTKPEELQKELTRKPSMLSDAAPDKKHIVLQDGSSANKLSDFHRKNYFLYVVAVAISCVIGVLGFRQYQESVYINDTTKMVQDFKRGHEKLIEAVKNSYTASNTTEREIASQTLEEAQKNLDTIVQNNMQRRVPSQHAVENLKILQLLLNELAIIQRVNFICETPANGDAKEILDDLHVSIEKLKEEVNAITMPGVDLTLMTVDLDLLKNELRKYMDKERLLASLGDYPTGETVTPADGWYKISPMHAQEKALDVSGAQIGNGINIQIWDWIDAPRQKFYLQKRSNDYYTIKTGHCDMYMDAAGGVPQKGENVWQYTYNGTSAQFWRFIDAGNGSVYIETKMQPGLTLDCAGGKKYNGNNVQLWTRENVAWHKWKLNPTNNLKDRQ